MKKLLSVFTALIVIMSVLSVSASAASPKISKSNVTLPEGYQITLNVSNASDKVEWSVKDSGIASVKSTGDNTAKVTGKKTGATYVYAKTGGKTLKCMVNVRLSVISASAKPIELEKGKSQTVTLTVKGSKAILAKPDDPSVCSIAWGKKWDGDKITLKITAKKNGSTKIKLYNKNSPDSTDKTLTVTVGKQETAEKKSDTATFGGTADTTDKADTAAADTSEMIKQVAEIVNKERKAAGKNELEFDDTLNEIAAIRAEEISTKFDHTRPDGSKWSTAFDEAGLYNCYGGENIAAGQKNAEEAMYSWMHSSGHKANILDVDYTKIGVGCYLYNGTYYWVQEFWG